MGHKCDAASSVSISIKEIISKQEYDAILHLKGQLCQLVSVTENLGLYVQNTLTLILYPFFDHFVTTAVTHRVVEGALVTKSRGRLGFSGFQVFGFSGFSNGTLGFLDRTGRGARQHDKTFTSFYTGTSVEKKVFRWVGGGWSQSDYSVCPRPLHQFIQV